MTCWHRLVLPLPTMVILFCIAAATPAKAHGPGGSAFVLLAALVIAVPIVSSVADRFAVRRWLSIELTTKATILANLAAIIVSICVVTWFYELVGAIAGALEPHSVNAASLLRDYSAYLRLAFAALGLVLAKALFLKWYVPLPLTLRSVGVLLLSTFAAVGGTIGLELLSVWLLL